MADDANEGKITVHIGALEYSEITMEFNIKQPVFRTPVVMLIDDQALVAHRVKDLLKNEEDIDFHYCQDPAVAIAQAMQIKPTLILMDLVMPNIDGLTLCRVFRETPETADIPIVMLSANDDGQTKAFAFASGANDYLVKLPEQIEFIARIRYHSKSYIIKLERDEAYEALCQSQIELEAINLRLEQMAYQDELTRLPNRPVFIDRLAMAMAQAKRGKQFVALLFLDLDDFKPVNDRYGHQAGDEVLKTIAQRLLDCVRETDTVARLGGDEFAVVLGMLDDPRHAAEVAEKIIHACAGPIPLPEKQECTVGVSIGISIFPGDGKDIDRLQAYADHAMYQSKRAGKNRYSFFEDSQQNVRLSQAWIDFREEHQCGITLFDQQHMNLINLLNRLNLAIDIDALPEVIVKLFDQVFEQVSQHFATEEELLKKHQFPDYEKHKAEHLSLLDELRGFRTSLHTPGKDMVASRWLKVWLLDHIRYADRESARFLLAQGVQ
jgi:two-component system chemotaxis family response regulator WspR